MIADMVIQSVVGGVSGPCFTVSFTADDDPRSGVIAIEVPFNQTQAQQSAKLKDGVAAYINSVRGANVITGSDVRQP